MLVTKTVLVPSVFFIIIGFYIKGLQLSQAVDTEVVGIIFEGEKITPFVFYGLDEISLLFDYGMEGMTVPFGTEIGLGIG